MAKHASSLSPIPPLYLPYISPVSPLDLQLGLARLVSLVLRLGVVLLMVRVRVRVRARARVRVRVRVRVRWMRFRLGLGLEVGVRGDSWNA